VELGRNVEVINDDKGVGMNVRRCGMPMSLLGICNGYYSKNLREKFNPYDANRLFAYGSSVQTIIILQKMDEVTVKYLS
jgi:hypothetical protein